VSQVVTNYPNRTDYMLEEWCEDGTCRQTAGVFFKKRFSATGTPPPLIYPSSVSVVRFDTAAEERKVWFIVRRVLKCSVFISQECRGV
jgi:hypothetical protein